MPFSNMMNDTISIIKPDGTSFDNIKASVQHENIFVMNGSLPIEEGDSIIRILPNNMQEEYIVLDRGFYPKSGGIPANFQMKVEKKIKNKQLADNKVSITMTMTNNEYFKYREPQTEKPFVFVVMPFNKDIVSNDVYELGIKDAIESFNLKCVRIDEDLESKGFMDKIYSHILDSELVIVDFTGERPNCYYEAGIAHALNKEVIIISQTGDSVPADIKHFNYHTYSKDNISGLKNRLKSIIDVVLKKKQK